MLNFSQPAATHTDDAAVAAPRSERAMAITPLEMRQTSFASGWRGYSREAVRAFLVDASESYELSLRERETDSCTPGPKITRSSSGAASERK